jgi:hypothetical protein
VEWWDNSRSEEFRELLAEQEQALPALRKKREEGAADTNVSPF